MLGKIVQYHFLFQVFSRVVKRLGYLVIDSGLELQFLNQATHNEASTTCTQQRQIIHQTDKGNETKQRKTEERERERDGCGCEVMCR